MNVLIRSSVDPDKVGVTFQGAVGLILVSLLPYLGASISENEIVLFIKAVVAVVSGLAVIAGTFRKLWVGFKLNG